MGKLSILGFLLLTGCASPGVDPETWPALASRAEAARGLRFHTPARVEAVARDQMAEQLRRELELQNEPEVLRDTAQALAVLGFAAPGLDLVEVMSRFGGMATVGFYSPATHRLVVAADAGDRALDVEAIVVHELVHALQDQNSSWVQVLLGLRDHDDLAFAIGALVEGDALLAEFEEARARDHAVPEIEEMLDAFGPESAQEQYPDVPRLLRESLLLQYALGYRLVASAHASGERDALFAAPALSSEQLLHPEKRLDPLRRDEPGFVELPASAALGLGACRELARTTLGELGIRIWIEEQLDFLEGRVEPLGWDGDRVLVFACGDEERIVWAFAADSIAEAEGIEAALGAAAHARAAADPRLGRARVERRGERLLLTIGVGRAAREAAWQGMRVERFSDLRAYLDAHPAVLERAARFQREH